MKPISVNFYILLTTDTPNVQYLLFLFVHNTEHLHLAPGKARLVQNQCLFLSGTPGSFPGPPAPVWLASYVQSLATREPAT